MEIEVGEYVRTEEGYIGKLVEIRKEYLNYYKIDVEKEIYHIDTVDNYIYSRDGFGLKHSKNIIDLIEVGDFVNGHKVTDKYEDTDDLGNDFITIEVESDLMLYKSLLEKHIKSILTHEQYSKNSYKVVE